MTDKLPPYAPPPRSVREVGQRVHDEQKAAYERYMAAVAANNQRIANRMVAAAESFHRKRENREGSADMESFSTRTYIVDVTLDDGTEFQFREQGLSEDRNEALAQGRKALDSFVDLMYGTEVGISDLANERANKPRGKPLQPGGDPRQKQHQDGGEGQQGEGDDAEGDDAEGDAGEGDDAGGEGEGEQDGDGDPDLVAIQQQMEQLAKGAEVAKQAAEQAKQGKGPLTPDLVLMRKHNAPLEGYAAVSAIGDVAATTVAGSVQQLAQAIAQLTGTVAKGGNGKGTVDPQQLEQLVREIVQQARIDLDGTKTASGETLREAMEKMLRPTEQVVKHTLDIAVTGEDGAVTTMTVEQEHAALADVLDFLECNLPAALIGPTGCGKTHLAKTAARTWATARGLPFMDTLANPTEQGVVRFGSVSVTSGMSEGVLSGWYVPHGENGEWTFLHSAFAYMYEHGGVFLVDEGDAASGDVLLFMNQAVSNDVLPLPRRPGNQGGPFARRHPEFRLLMAMNTYGRGADRLYVGRNALDDATLDRFRMGQVDMDYDRALEDRLVTNPALKRAFWQLRDAVGQHRLQRNVSTRALLDAQKLVTKRGWTVDRCVGQLTKGWTASELKKVGRDA